MPRPGLLGGAAVAIAFVATCAPYLALPPGSDGWKNLWLIGHTAPWQFLHDPTIAGYAFRFYFEPLWALSFYPDLALAEWLGAPGYHLVNIAVALVIAWQIAGFVGRGRAGAAAAALFLASPVVWFCVAMPTARNYLLGAALALAAARPYWNADRTGRPAAAGAVAGAVACYALAVASKEAMAALPALLFALDLRAGRRLPAALLRMLPFAVALAFLLLWRWHVLGGLGGYFMAPTFVPTNILAAFPMLGTLLWGPAAPLGAAALVACAWIVPRRGAAVTIACLVAALPFVLAGDLAANDLFPVAAIRLLLAWAWLAVLAGSAAASSASPRLRWASALALLALLWFQFGQRPVVDAGVRRALPIEPIAAAQADEPVAIISEASMALAFEHQSRRTAKPPLAAYQSPASFLLDRALGFAPEPDATNHRIRDDWNVPELPPLVLGDSRVWADAAGHFHAELTPEVARGLTLSWIHVNGPTRWVVTLPVGRTRLALPVSRSVRAIVLAKVDMRADRWPTFVWESPFFQPVFP